MTRKIFQYLFLFSLLIALFFYVNGRNQSTFFNDQVDRLMKKTEKLTDSISQLNIDHHNTTYFSLDGNHDAKAFYKDLSPTTIEQLIEDQMLLLNDASKGNPILSSIGRDYIINKIQLVNHHWLLADFTNGKRWGDVLVFYEIDSKNRVSLRLIDHVFYP
ncbi:MAG: hypothetical protein ISP68_03860 [Flavobacteriaceae bacterium]|nr:hypothetical protein [Flavobacteriaceae bacterium]